MAFMGPGGAKQGILSLNVKDVASLHKVYMPFLENGGIFVPTNKAYKLGDEVFLLLSIKDEEKMPVTGKVAWITPTGSQGLKRVGIGIQFSDSNDMEVVRSKIETLLAPYRGEDVVTETM